MRVLISGGGTGGHIFPALAVAQALADLDPTGEVLYVGRRGGMEEEIVPGHGLALETLTIRGIQPEPWKNWRLPYQLPAAVARAAGLIRRFDPAVVFGTGGYVVGAVGAAAVASRRPLYLMVPDAFPGRAIRALSRPARTVFTAFPASARHLPGAHVVMSGTPLRRDFAEAGGAIRALPAVARPLRRVVVIGGSQGAHRINTAVAEGLKALLELPEVSVHHLCGSQDVDDLLAMRGGLDEERRRRYTVEAFSDRVIDLLSDADLVVSRAGGSAIAEATAMGRPMLLVPYPFAGAHQRFNAEPLVAAGAAVLVPDQELSGVRLVAEVGRLARDPGALASMRAASLSFGRPGAAADIARALLEARG